MSSRRILAPSPPHATKINSDATCGGRLASFTYSPDLEAPLLLHSQADQALGHVASTTNKVFISELFVVVASMFAPRGKLRNRNLIVFPEDEAARAALTEGTSKSEAASTLVYYVWLTVASIHAPLWKESVPFESIRRAIRPRAIDSAAQLLYPGTFLAFKKYQGFRDMSVNAAD